MTPRPRLTAPQPRLSALTDIASPPRLCASPRRGAQSRGAVPAKNNQAHRARHSRFLSEVFETWRNPAHAGLGDRYAADALACEFSGRRRVAGQTARNGAVQPDRGPMATASGQRFGPWWELGDELGLEDLHLLDDRVPALGVVLVLVSELPGEPVDPALNGEGLLAERGWFVHHRPRYREAS